MVFRCELCDSFLSVFQFSHLCENCYKIRTIVKCYDEAKVLESLEDNFLVSEKRKEEAKEKDKEFFEKEEKRLEEAFHKEVKELQEKKVAQLETIKEEVLPSKPLPHIIHNTRQGKKTKFVRDNGNKSE